MTMNVVMDLSRAPRSKVGNDLSAPARKQRAIFQNTRSGWWHYVIQPGDTYVTIARRFNVPLSQVQFLCTVNPSIPSIGSGYYTRFDPMPRAGTVIRIPPLWMHPLKHRYLGQGGGGGALGLAMCPDGYQIDPSSGQCLDSDGNPAPAGAPCPDGSTADAGGNCPPSATPGTCPDGSPMPADGNCPTGGPPPGGCPADSPYWDPNAAGGVGACVGTCPGGTSPDGSNVCQPVNNPNCPPGTTPNSAGTGCDDLCDTANGSYWDSTLNGGQGGCTPVVAPVGPDTLNCPPGTRPNAGNTGCDDICDTANGSHWDSSLNGGNGGCTPVSPPNPTGPAGPTGPVGPTPCQQGVPGYVMVNGQCVLVTPPPTGPTGPIVYPTGPGPSPTGPTNPTGATGTSGMSTGAKVLLGLGLAAAAAAAAYFLMQPMGGKRRGGAAPRRMGMGKVRHSALPRLHQPRRLAA